MLPVAAQYKLPEPIRFPTPDFNEIYEIEQDGNSLLWLATDKGLFCFDGSLFRRITHAPNEVSGLDNSRINDLFADRDEGKLWIATVEGASALDLRTETFTDFTFYRKDDPYLTDGECHSIFKDRAGALWFGVSGMGLARLEAGRDSIPFPFPLTSGEEFPKGVQNPSYIYQIAQDATKDSILWMAASNIGLIGFNKETGRYHIPDQRGIAEEVNSPAGMLTFTSLYPTKDKIFLGNTWVNFCVVYDLKNRCFRTLDFEQPFGLSVLQDRSPTTFWNYRGPVNIIDIEKEQIIHTFSKPYEEEGLLDGFLATPGRFWISSSKGLLHYDFSAYQVENHILFDERTGKPAILHAVLEKEDATGFWLVFQKSDFLYEYDRKEGIRRALPWPGGIPGSPVRLQDGRILFFTGVNGFYELRDNRLYRLPLFEELTASGVHFTTAVQDRNGYLWLGSNPGGLFKLDLEKGQYQDYGKRIGLTGVSHIFLDQDDNIWIGKNGFLVYHARKDTFFTFPFEPGKKKTIHYPRGFAQDAEGNAWMSDIRVGGLMKVDPSRLEEGIQQRFVAQNGARSNRMWQPTIDRRGRIWTITLDGLQVFDPQQESFTLYGASAGLRLRTADGMYDNFIPPYLTLLSTGEMLAGYKEGFAIFHPDSLQGNSELPRPYLLALEADGQALTAGPTFDDAEQFSLKYHQDRIAFEFSAVAWREPEKVRFAYRMKGLDEQWTQTDRRSVQYINLSPGSYTFQLHAINSDGKMREKPLEVHFGILPPWWQAWWAFALYLAAILAAAYLLYAYKKRQWQWRTKLALEHHDAERLRELNELKTRLYTNITHEFRTPLTIILGMADRVGSDPQEWFREGIEMIKRNGRYLLRLVNQMLDLRKLETGSLPVEMVQGDIVAYLKYLIESFQSHAGSKKVRLHLLNRENKLLMDYDPEKMTVIFSNLLSNAIKFTPEGGEVFVEFGRERTDAGNGQTTRAPAPDHGEKWFRIYIRDTGIGIPPKELPHIFDRFYQAAGSGKDHARGTGIGLALTRELVRLLGGEITASSKEGAGTVFLMRLPITRKAKPPDGALHTLRPEDSAAFLPADAGSEWSAADGTEEKPLVLIVEDNRDVMAYLKACLETDYCLAFAADGQQGVCRARDLVPDLIVSDVMMPHKDGYELTQELKNHFLTSHIPIILLTAKADVDSRMEGLSRGADAYLTKPFYQQELHIRVKKLLELRKQLQRHYQSFRRPEPGKGMADPIEEAFLQKIDQTLEAHLSDENFGIPQLCRAVGISRAQLHRKLKALTGRSASHYLRSYRLFKAKEILQGSDLNITQVSMEVGYKHLSHFTAAFKKEFGINPSEIRF